MSEDGLGSLVSQIAQAQYESADLNGVPEGVNLAETAQSAPPDPGVGDATTQPPEPAAPARPDTPPPAQTSAGVDPQFVGQIARELQDARARLQQVEADKQLAALQQEEYDFADSIAHLPAWQQDLLLTRRDQEKSQQAALHLQQRLMQQQAALDRLSQEPVQQQEALYKKLTAFHMMGEAGFDFLDPANAFIVESLVQPAVTEPEQMKQILDRFSAIAGRNRPPIIAGGARATNAGAPALKPGSGDLMALINNRSYELVGTG